MVITFMCAYAGIACVVFVCAIYCVIKIFQVNEKVTRKTILMKRGDDVESILRE